MNRFNFLRKFIFIVLAVLGMAFSAYADNHGAHITGALWTDFTFDLTKDAGNESAFDVSRAYLGIGYKFNDNWSSQLTFDAGRVLTGRSNATEKSYLLSAVKHGYIQNSNQLAGLQFRFGLQPTFYLEAVEKAAGTRWLGKTLLDQTGLQQSAVGGVSFKGQASILHYGVMLHNGAEGVDKTPNNNSLGAAVYLGAVPLSSESSSLGIHVTAEVVSGSSSGTPVTEESTTVGLGLAWESGFVDVAAELGFRKPETGDNLLGYGLTFNVKLMEEALSIYARIFTGNDGFLTLLSGGVVPAKFVLSAGPTYTFVKDKIATALLFETVKADPNQSYKSIQTIMWKWMAQF